MLQISGLKLPPGASEQALRKKAARILRLKVEDIKSMQIVRKSIDAREQILIVYTVVVSVPGEDALLRRCRDKHVTRYAPKEYTLPPKMEAPDTPPVVVGAGPGGLFAALVLARCGLRPILLERGQCAEQRQQDVADFWRTGILNTQSNVQFGEGGAGAFSDGKLNTGTKDLRHRWILQELVAHGAPETILYDAKPHVGTDYLHRILPALRRELLDLGADIRFSHRLIGLHIEDGAIQALEVESSDGPYTLPARQVILALGHSARDTFEMLYASGVKMEQKPFAMGVRIEHRQQDMDAAQYKKYASHPCLPASTYKLSCHLPNGRSAFSFCVCPGGQVVAAASETGRVVTNGMSEYARDRDNINGALLVNVTPEDFGSTHPLAGIALQRKWEKIAYQVGGGQYHAPCQRVEDFLLHRPSVRCGKVVPSYQPAVTYANLWDCLPPFIADTLALALPELEKKIHGYADGDALLTAIESRSSSPVRIVRDNHYCANISGIYPCGEGAGYAGGILSAAADGMRTAEKLMEQL